MTTLKEDEARADLSIIPPDEPSTSTSVRCATQCRASEQKQVDSGYHESPQNSDSTFGKTLSSAEDLDSAVKEFHLELEMDGANSSLDLDNDSCSSLGDEDCAPDSQGCLNLSSEIKAFQHALDATGVNPSFELDEEDLEVFDTLVRSNSNTDGASRSNVSQPNVSDADDLPRVIPIPNPTMTDTENLPLVIPNKSATDTKNPPQVGLDPGTKEPENLVTHPNPNLPDPNPDGPEEDSRIWGLTMNEINSADGDPREILTSKPRWTADAVVFGPTVNGVISIVSDQPEMSEEEDEIPMVPVFPVNVDDLQPEEKEEILKLVLARSFKDFIRLDFNIKPETIGEAALRVASELRISGFKTPGEAWIKTWKAEFLHDPCALSFGWQVGKIVDTKNGNVLRRDVHLTGKRFGPNSSLLGRDHTQRFPSPFLKASFKEVAGKTIATSQGKLRCFISIAPVMYTQKRKTRITEPSFRLARPSVSMSDVILSSRLSKRSQPKASDTKRRHEKDIDTIIKYNEDVEAREASIAAATPGEPLNPMPEPQANLTSTVESLEAAAATESDLESNLFDSDIENAFSSEQLDLLYGSGSGDDFDSINSVSHSDSSSSASD